MRNGSRLKEEHEAEVKSECFIQTKENSQLHSEILYLREELTKVKAEKYEMEMELSVMRNKVQVEKMAKEKVRFQFEEVAKDLEKLKKFKGQIEGLEQEYPGCTIKEIITRLKESEKGYLTLVGDLMDSESKFNSDAKVKSNAKKVYEEKTLELVKTKTQCEQYVEDLRKDILVKENEMMTLKDYKDSYLSLSNRLIGLFASWQRNNKAFFSDKDDSKDDISLKTPKEIMTALENLVEISTPVSAQNYIRKFLVEFNLLQRKIFGDIIRGSPEISFVCNKIFEEFKKLRSQNKEFLGKIRDSKRKGTIIEKSGFKSN